MIRKIQMADVVRAHMEVSGCPVLTSNQCHAIAMNLNCQIGLTPAYDEAKERELFEAWYGSERIPFMDVNSRFMHDQDGTYWFIGTRKAWTGWLACAKSRAGIQS